MASIDYTICGFDEVIAYSMELHPRLLSDRIRAHARVHVEFADAYADQEVMRNELALADKLSTFADAIDRGDYLVLDQVEVRQVALSCAAWPQDLHPIMQDVIAEREEARNARPGQM